MAASLNKFSKIALLGKLPLTGKFCTTNVAPCILLCRDVGSFRHRADEMVDGKIPEDEFEELSDVEIMYEFKLPRKKQPKIREPLPHETTRRWFSKKYAKEGKASGVDPSIIWPTKRELENMKEMEKEWMPTLDQMQKEIQEEDEQYKQNYIQRMKRIDEAMAKLPQLEAEFERKEEELRQKEKARQEKRNAMLAIAREKLGYAVDPRSKIFQNMLDEAEAEERKRKKELKKKGIKV